MSLPMAYAIKSRSKKMAKGGMAHCAHGGPAYCNDGCYADGGLVEEMNPMQDSHQSEDAAKSSKQGMAYEMERDEPMNEMPNKPKSEMPHSMDSEMAEEEGNMVSEDEPMKMARSGFMKAKPMVKMMMAHGGIVSKEAWDKASQYQMGMEDHSGGPSDKEDIDIAWTTPHDDNLSSEGEYPLMEEEGYEEGRQAKMRRKGGLLERVMSKIHSK